MKQQIDLEIWDEFSKEQQKARKKLEKKVVKNTGEPIKDSWTEKITSKIKISDLAEELNVDCCPVCSYGIDFDDSRGWFICHKKKYENSCDFAGNIVGFMERCA